jgi:hypothetical protein
MISFNDTPPSANICENKNLELAIAMKCDAAPYDFVSIGYVKQVPGTLSYKNTVP